MPGGGPSTEWVRAHGGTPKCPGCSEKSTSSRHSQRCVRRYQKRLRDSIDGALEELDKEPSSAVAPPAKRVRFGSEEILEFPAPGTPAEREDGAEANDHLSDYEPSEDEEEDDLMGVAAPPAPPASQEERPAVRLLEELWACGCVRYVPTRMTACDAYDLQAFCSLLVDGRSSCDKLPYACIASLESVEHDVGRVERVGRSSMSMSVGRSVGRAVGRA